MPFEASALTSLVYIDHLSMFPSAATSTRANPATGVPVHNPAYAFIEALCTGVVAALKPLPINDLGAGILDVPGTAVPVPVTFPGINAAQAYLVGRMGWTGSGAASASAIFVSSVLLGISKISLLQMPTNPLMGTGTGVVSPVSNPGLEAAALSALNAALPAAFQATGKFGEGDVPSAPVNAMLLAQLPGYAEALAKGFASITTAVPYVGVGAPTTPVAGVLNTGFLV